ncbi:prostaglandin E2 receptor EP4 subtype-like [Sapajus apella]|uniref:Prostaglandin E2 receptor EP4 subtype-like n=1 Tax=Sapajus apella TaxID=9515 RepID=A0A6J3HFW0_SAPAP|nr:prostaglandin E2 receptor EP4 subtype-like [Sapajus apella]
MAALSLFWNPLTQLHNRELRTTSHRHVHSLQVNVSLLEPNLLNSLGPSTFRVLGNLVAIVMLGKSRKEQKETTFYTLACGW